MTNHIANINWNSKYIGYECVVCEKTIDEDERQKIISLGPVQTWCLSCMSKKFIDDDLLIKYAQTHGHNKNDMIIDRNKLLNQ